MVRGTSTRLRRRWGALAWRSRVAIAAGCLAAAAALAPGALRPPTPPTVAVAVAARELSPGTTLTAADVRIVRIGASLAPNGAPSAEDAVVGRRTAVAVPAGTPLVTGVVRSSTGRPSVPPGLVLAPVHLADPDFARVLAPGDRVGILAGSSDAATGVGIAETIVERALVVGVDGHSGDGSGGLFGSAPDSDLEPLVLVAVTPEDAARLAAAALSASITAVLVE